jgi:hypothetical protein
LNLNSKQISPTCATVHLRVGFRDRLEREKEGERGEERGAVKSNRYTEESKCRGKMREGKRGAERGTAGKMERERGRGRESESETEMEKREV